MAPAHPLSTTPDPDLSTTPGSSFPRRGEKKASPWKGEVWRG